MFEQGGILFVRRDDGETVVVVVVDIVVVISCRRPNVQELSESSQNRAE